MHHKILAIVVRAALLQKCVVFDYYLQLLSTSTLSLSVFGSTTVVQKW